MLNEMNQGREMNNVSYYPYSPSVQAQEAGISHFNYTFTTCCNSKVSEGLWSLKNVFAFLNTSF